MDQANGHLLTVHGSLVWFDEATNTLRHAAQPPGGPPLPRNCTLEDRRAGCALVFGMHPAPVTLDGLGRGGRIGRAPASPGLTFHRRRLADGLFALEANGLFLCAEADGTISLSRNSQGPWEVFSELDAADLDWLAHLGGNMWLSATGGNVLPRDAVRPVHGFRAQLGDIAVPLRDLLAENRPGCEVCSFTVQYDGWKVEHLTIYRPLIYMIAFGKDEIFDCLNLALQSLREFGQYAGDILLFTDRPPDRLDGIVPAGMQGQVRLAAAPAADVLDFTATKFRICDLKEAEHHQPLLYLDTDVICDRPVEGVLREIRRAGRLCVPLEHDLLGAHNFYGATLFAADPSARPRSDRGFSSGLIGIPDMAVARRNFPAILRCLYAQARLAGTRHPSDWYDQPAANYVLHKTDAADFAVMTPRVVTPVDTSRPVAAIPRLGFAHFCGGVGNTSAKLPAMRAYLDLLRQAG